MGHYIMRLPADMPELTYDALSAYLDKKGRRRATIGTTVEVARNPASEVAAYIDLRLYALDIARIYRDCVTFPAHLHGDSRQSTRQWLERVVRDNGIGTTVYRVRRRKSDGPGWGGVLVIDGDRERPVAGRTYSSSKGREMARAVSTGQQVKVTRDVSRHNPRNWSGRDVGKGEVFYRYTGSKWGVVHDDETTTVLTSEPGGEFFEFPVDAVEEAGT